MSLQLTGKEGLLVLYSSRTSWVKQRLMVSTSFRIVFMLSEEVFSFPVKQFDYGLRFLLIA